MAPPAKLVELPLRVQLATVSVAEAVLKMAPPAKLVELPLRVQLATVSVPSLKMPPPPMAELLLKVALLIVAVAEVSL